MMGIRTYSEMTKLLTFEDRFRYLMLNGNVSEETFGFDRYLNQRFYTSKEWRQLRNHIIVRDGGCDLGIPDREIFGKVMIHHLNPLSPKDIVNATDFLLNPEYLVCVSHDTHNAIHYGDVSYITSTLTLERKPGDTTPWKKG